MGNIGFPPDVRQKVSPHAPDPFENKGSTHCYEIPPGAAVRWLP